MSLDIEGRGETLRKEPLIMFSAQETDYLNSRPLARIATASGKSPEPDVAPLGFDFDGTYFYVGGHQVENTLKYKNVLSNPKVALVVDDLPSMDPWTPRGIKIHGVADIAAREGYAGPAKYIRIEPKRKWSWGIETPNQGDGP